MQTYTITKDELNLLKDLAKAAATSHFMNDRPTVIKASELINLLLKQPDTTPPMGKEKIDQMVSRFLSWKLPADFAPDGGISFKPFANHFMSAEYQYKHEPIGTNLFTADQAKAMFLHALDLS